MKFRGKSAVMSFGALFIAATGMNEAFAEGLKKRVIVKYQEEAQMSLFSARGNSASAIGHFSKAEKASVKIAHKRAMSLANHHVYTIEAETEADLIASMESMALESGVAYVEEDKLLKAYGTTNDARLDEMWHLGSFDNTNSGINMSAAWDLGKGSGAVVAVLDTGYIAHKDLAANLLPGYDMISDADIGVDGDGRDSDASDPGDWYSNGECGFGSGSSDSSWHGTHVAGTIAAVGNNSEGIVGVAYESKIVPVRVLGKCGGYTSDIADGILWAAGLSVSGVPTNANPADVINMSLGGSGSCSSTTQSAINQAVAAGTTVVVAAGNSNANANNFNPGNCNNVINVAATNKSGERAWYSNYGSSVDVAGPGGETNGDPSLGVLSTIDTGKRTPAGDGYGFYQGTSMATPHVAGVAAILYGLKPEITPAEVESILKANVSAVNGSCSGCGTGIVDAAKAAAAVDGGIIDPPPPPTSELNEPNLSASSGSWLHFTIEVGASASQLVAELSGGTSDSDADLYVRYGSNPTYWRFDCRSWQSGSDESCLIENPAAGTWHVSVRAYSAFSGVDLVATVK